MLRDAELSQFTRIINSQTVIKLSYLGGTLELFGLLLLLK